MEKTFICQVGGKKTQAPGSQGHQDPGGELQVSMTVRGVQGDLSPSVHSRTYFRTLCVLSRVQLTLRLPTSFSHPLSLPITSDPASPQQPLRSTLLAWPGPRLGPSGTCALWGRLRTRDLWRPRAATKQVLPAPHRLAQTWGPIFLDKPSPASSYL